MVSLLVIIGDVGDCARHSREAVDLIDQTRSPRQTDPETR
jgi:hypothetical protein